MLLQQTPEFIQQPQQGGGQWVYVQQPLAQPTLWGYIQQPQQAMAQPVQLTPPGVGQWGYAQPPQTGMGQMPYAQPHQEFGGQTGQFAGRYDLQQRMDVPQSRKGPKNYVRSDERIRELICERLIQDLSIDASDVSIEVEDGRVSVTGSVPQRHMKHAIEDVVVSCWGVKNVDNEMRVQEQQGASIAIVGQQATAAGRAGGGFAGSS